MTAYKQSANSALDGLKLGWRMVKFGDIAENVAVRVAPADAKTDVYVGLEHLDPSTIHLRQWGHPSDVTGQKLYFKKGDVIFGRRRAYQRKLAVAEFDGICSAHAMVVRAKPKMILPEFLPFFLQSDMFMERAIEISVGSLSPTINWKTLRAQEFPLPPLDGQKRFAEILWAADEAAEAYESVLLSLERSVDVYSDKNFLLHEARKKKPDIPPGWRIGFLNEIAKIDPSMPKGLPDELDVSFVPMESVNEGGGISKSEIKKLGEVRKGHTYFEENDVLFAKITPCMENGKGAIAVSLKNNIAMGSTEYYVFRSIKSEDTQLLRSGTSIEANVEEGQAAQSRADFIAKYYIACKEARETHYWIRLLGATDVLPAERLAEISAECNELIAILTSIVNKLNS